ncbi:hypothetical protein HBI08_163010 [Parastagonospora nodorum]|nr:hypothetical protein HBI08_163010 [Parastagonospora nodorum]
MTLISDEYKILYAEVKREIRERAILYYLLQSIVPNSRLRIITSLNYTQFIQTLKREVEFKDKRSSIYYYTKTADNTVTTKLYRATFIIKLLI